MSVCCWQKGYRGSPSTDDLEQDDRVKRRGSITGSKAGAYAINAFGRCWTSGVSADYQFWENGPSNQLGDMNRVAGGGIFTTFRPNNTTQANEDGILCKRQSGGALQSGWSFQTNGTTAYEYEISDGASNTDSGGVGTLTPSVVQTFAGRHRLGTNRFVQLTIDGGRQRSTNTTVSVTGTPTNFQNVTMFANSSGSPVVPGQSNMAIVHNRPVTVSEQQMHYRDPYALWRDPKQSRFMFGLSPGEASINTFFLAF